MQYYGRNGSDKGKKGLVEAEKVLVICYRGSFSGNAYHDVAW